MGKPWFSPKLFGYGAGLPISWEGWAALGGYVAVMVVGALVIEFTQSPYRLLAAIPMALASIMLIVVARARTRGGWRWGDED